VPGTDLGFGNGEILRESVRRKSPVGPSGKAVIGSPEDLCPQKLVIFRKLYCTVTSSERKQNLKKPALTRVQRLTPAMFL